MLQLMQVRCDESEVVQKSDYECVFYSSYGPIGESIAGRELEFKRALAQKIAITSARKEV